MPNRTISVVGLGYIGLPTAAVIASRGVKVIGVDVRKHVVDTVNSGGVHIVEPDLDMVVHSTVASGKLKAYDSPQPADAFLIAVPTPFDGEHRPDLSYIESASRAVAKVLKAGDTVILESTSPVGATEQMCAWMAEARPDLSFPTEKGEQSDVRVAHCPERVLPGQVLRELVDNDRVIGGMTERCCEAAKSVYQLFVRGNLVCTDVRTAEMCKLTENAFRDVNIAFANEVSMICDSYGIDVWELISLANRHPRVNILRPGPGVGGHCIAVDPWFLISHNPDLSPLMASARRVNDAKPGYVVCKVLERVKLGATIACLGLAFKPNVDDLRESPALRVVEELASLKKYKILAVEPHIGELPQQLSAFNCIELVTLSDAIQSADLLVGLVAHDGLKKGLLSSQVRQDKILDFVGMFAVMDGSVNAFRG
jgi:UDP-N-acetyl-D-mannosaminuronic acid dehydrogenase